MVWLLTGMHGIKTPFAANLGLLAPWVHQFLARGCVYGGFFRRIICGLFRITENTHGPSPIIHWVEALERYPRRHPAATSRVRSPQHNKVQNFPEEEVLFLLSTVVPFTSTRPPSEETPEMWATHIVGPTWRGTPRGNMPCILRTQRHWWLGTIDVPNKVSHRSIDRSIPQ
jgi:hypothetical protein